MTDICAYSVLATRRRASPVFATGQGKRLGARRRRRNRALFLDFDGVLHPTLFKVDLEPVETIIGTGLFGWLPNLARALAPYPEVVIVVHSTWRHTHDDDELRMLLDPVSTRVLGSTPPGIRYESILEWLRQNPTFTDYRILDDETVEFPDPAPVELIVCDPRTGVSAPTVQAALRQWLDP